MKFSSKTLWKAMFLSSLSFPVFADINDPGIAYCKGLGGCGSDGIFEQIAQSIFDTCTKEPSKKGCQQFNQKLNNDYLKKTEVKNEVLKCIPDGSNFGSPQCQDIRDNAIDAKYESRAKVEQCIDNGKVNVDAGSNTFCNDTIQKKISAKYPPSSNTNSGTSPQCTAQEISNKVSQCINNSSENKNNFDSTECADLRNKVIDSKFIWKENAQSYLTTPSTKGADALYLGTHYPTNGNNTETAATLFRDISTVTQEQKNGRIFFKWVSGLKPEKQNKELKSVDLAQDAESLCGVVMALNGSDVNNIICKTDYDAIKSCPDNKKLRCEQ